MVIQLLTCTLQPEIRLYERRVLMDFVRRCVIKAGASPAHADIIAEILTEADCRGVHSHVCYIDRAMV